MKVAIPIVKVSYLNDVGETEHFELTKDGEKLHDYLTELDKHRFITFKELGLTINTSRIIKVESSVKDKTQYKIVEKDGNPVAVPL